MSLESVFVLELDYDNDGTNDYVRIQECYRMQVINPGLPTSMIEVKILLGKYERTITVA